MGTIHVLPEQLINQITAGEVIDRPAAVVKELVENSLDAQATQIRIEFQQGGKLHISVEDNGLGMEPDDAVMALKSHATSKLRLFDDLERLHTFGFRGEALASIASVAKLRLRTRCRTAAYGTEVLSDFGALQPPKDCGMPYGTYIEAHRLFKNLPSRKLFLKSDAYEAAVIHQLTRIYAIASPQTAFSLKTGGKTLFQSPTCASLKERILEIWGDILADVLMPVDNAVNNLCLQGWIGKPTIHRHSRKDIVWIVNNRPIESAQLNALLYEAYAQALPKNRYPISFLFLTLPPEIIDINVHPMKREIRFREESIVKHFILRSLQTTLHSGASSVFSGYPVGEASSPQRLEPIFQVTAPRLLQAYTSPDPASGLAAQPQPQQLATAALPSLPTLTDFEGFPWKFFGQLKPSYILFTSEKGVVFLHTKAAYERIYYERFQASLAAHSITKQTLGVANYITLDPLQAAYLKQNLTHWEHYGFEIEPFGPQQFKVQAIPAWIEQADATIALQQLVDLLANKSSPTSELESHIAANLATLTAKRAAVALNGTLNEVAICQLARDLLACSLPFTCPKGKPTFIETTFLELNRRFLQ